MKTKTITDFEGKRWRVTQELPTPFGFSVLKGILRDARYPREAYIPSKALMRYLRSLPSFKDIGGLPIPVSSFSSFRRKYLPPRILKDFQGRAWRITNEIPTKHGFTLWEGVPDGVTASGTSYIPTQEFIAYLQSLTSIQRHDLPLSKTAIKRIRSRYLLGKVVKDFLGRKWQVTHEIPTKHGFTLLMGFAGTPGVSGSTYIPTKELIAYLRSLSYTEDIGLPMSRKVFMRFLREYLPSRFVKDIEGKSWQVTDEISTKRGFDILMGVPYDRPGIGRSYILTNELARRLRPLVRRHQGADLFAALEDFPFSRPVIYGFKNRLMKESVQPKTLKKQ